ncbi:alkaline phosphatase [Dysgonomonas sp. Marseille-P4361]|uniref:alkaline phosphatase n=1 Tax=Dysgonomonas sp. Marseille-P4361 TaxID=2161820 RepID=UPI000D550F7F|nr:alkaline phosphatase [Dysgonomonas sp. Marseille-P4361]
MKHTLLFTMLVFVLTGCQQVKEVEDVKIKPLAEHVVMIGFDAMGSYSYDKAEMPVLKDFASKSAWTLDSRSVLPSSSAVNWASMLMSSSPSMHGYTEWGSKVPEIPSIAISQFGKFPSIYTQIEEQLPGAKTAVVYSWDGIIHFLEDQIIDINICTKEDEDLTAQKAAETILNEKPTFTFVHFDEPDGVGHGAGHDTPEFYEELKKVDLRLNTILQAVKDAGIEDKTIVIVVADHGGIDKGHGGKTMEEVRIPIFIKGPGIKVNYNIKSPVIDYDYGATIARMLGIEAHPAWRGKIIEEAFVE